MNIMMNTAMDLGKIKDDATRAQAAVVDLVDREADLTERLAEIEAFEGVQRYEAVASLVLEAEALVEIHKALKDQVNRVQKRIDKIASAVREGILDELSGIKGEMVETDQFLIKAKLNPPSVIVEDQKKIPKEWRHEPRPIPPWREWAPDKNAIKKALLNKEKRSIAGVHLERSKKLEITRK